MANIKQQRKRVKIAERQRNENIRYKSRIKTMFKTLTVAAQEDKEKASTMGLELVSLIDRAASRGVLHPNNAAHKKSRVASLVELPAGGAPKGPATTEPKNGKSKKDSRKERHEAKAVKEAAVKEKQKLKAETEAKAAAAAPAPEAPAEEPAAEAAPEEPAAATEETAAGEPAAEPAAAEETAAEEPATPSEETE